MPSLSHERLHGREPLVRALLAAGQFAHLDRPAIDFQLDGLYCRETRLGLRVSDYNNGDDHASLAEQAVPWALVKAANSGILPSGYFDCRAVDYIAARLGVVCCLCLAIDHERRWRNYAPRAFVLFCCPTFLRRDDGDVRAIHPLCAECERAVSNRFYREFGVFGKVTVAGVAATLSWLAANRTFRDRVTRNAGNLAKLRFDPRRVPERRAA